jgi:hypothetical protein
MALNYSHKLRNKATELEHGNALLRMENDIIGEHLIGLYEALNNLVFRKGVEDPMSFEVKRIATSLQTFTEISNGYTNRMTAVSKELDFIKTDFAESVTMRTEMKHQLERLSNVSKERIKSLSTQNKLLADERDKLMQVQVTLTMNYRDLMEEHDKPCQRIKQITRRADS